MPHPTTPPVEAPRSRFIIPAAVILFASLCFVIYASLDTRISALPSHLIAVSSTPLAQENSLWRHQPYRP